MATVQDIATAAFRKIMVASDDEDLTAAQIAQGVEAFNMMLHGWKLRGVDVSHVTQVAGDTFALGDEFQEGTVYTLAARLDPNYAAPATFDADDWFRTIQAAYTTIAESALERPVYLVPSRYARYGYNVTE